MAAARRARLIVFGAIVLGAACGPDEPEAASQVESGIDGLATFSTGNCMPRTRGESNCEHGPLATEILIFTPPVDEGDLRVTQYLGDRVPTHRLTSAEDGSFSIDLSPGEYSVLARFRGELYCSSRWLPHEQSSPCNSTVRPAARTYVDLYVDLSAS